MLTQLIAITEDCKYTRTKTYHTPVQYQFFVYQQQGSGFEQGKIFDKFNAD